AYFAMKNTPKVGSVSNFWGAVHRSGAFSGGASRSRTGLNGFAGRHIIFKINTLQKLTIRIDRSVAQLNS
ncbi:TPA: hypothetical protein ACXJGC_007120, partial [Burkholderia cenocepacia]